jgi:hypothetical protein
LKKLKQEYGIKKLIVVTNKKEFEIQEDYVLIPAKYLFYFLSFQFTSQILSFSLFFNNLNFSTSSLSFFISNPNNLFITLFS